MLRLCEVEDLLLVRGGGFSSHVFLYHNWALAKELVSARMGAVGDAVVLSSGHYSQGLTRRPRSVHAS